MEVEISPARQKMIEVMTLKGLVPVTQENYQRRVSVLSRDCGRASQRHRFDWKRKEHMTKILWPRASIRQPWSDRQFAVKHPR